MMMSDDDDSESRQGRHDELLNTTHGAYSELIAQQLKSTAKPVAEGNASPPDATAASSQPSTPRRNAPSGSETYASSKPTAGGVSEKVGGAGNLKGGKSYVRRAFALNRPELPWVGLGLLGALLNGALFPVRD
jgi:hypothetical protein